MVKKKSNAKNNALPDLDESRLSDPNYFYWVFLRPAEDEAELRRKRRRQRTARQQAKQTQQVNAQPLQIEALPDEAVLVQIIDGMIRTTHHAYGYCHLGELGQMLKEKYVTMDWSYYDCKNLLQFLQKYPAVFRIKWSAPAHKGASAVWVRLAYEPKRKAGYQTSPQ